MGHKSEVSRRVQNRCLSIGECFRGENECTNTKIEGQHVEKERKIEFNWQKCGLGVWYWVILLSMS
jgi:hypothetical protein